MRNFFNQPKFIQRKVCRVLIYNNAGGLLGTGSGFFIDKRALITCFHVVFRRELKNIRADAQFQGLAGNDEHTKLQTLYNGYNQLITIEDSSGKKFNATLNRFSEFYDCALLEVDTPEKSKPEICSIDLQSILSFGEKIIFGGFPTHHSYTPDTPPFALNEGIISTKVVTDVGGDSYEHYQINSVNLGGNSGAPLFELSGKKVIGIINGNMNWGRDDLAAITPNPQNGQTPITTVSLRVPLSIAYATPLKLIAEKTDLLNLK